MTYIIIWLLIVIILVLIGVWYKYSTAVFFRTIYNSELQDKMEDNDKNDKT